MAAVSTFPVTKRNKQGYGKVAGRSNWTVGNFFDDDEAATSEPSRSPRQERKVVSRSDADTKTQSKPDQGKQKSARPLPKRHDTFDVPSSDDEPVEIISKPGFKIRNTLVDDTDSSNAQLAPWEKKKAQANHNNAPKRRRETPASPDAQLRGELERATLSPELKPSSPSPLNRSIARVEIHSPPSESRKVAPDASSALARLAARRKEDVPSIAKRSALAADELESTPRKRARTATPPRLDTEDVAMIDTAPVVSCEVVDEEAKAAVQTGDIYAFPASSDDEMSNSRRKEVVPNARRLPKRSKLTAPSSKRTMKKGISAPARLSDMIATDTDDTTDAPTRSPSATSHRSTPQHQPSTPPRSVKAGSPQTAIKAKGTMTPKQAKLWSQLLPNDTIAPSPSALALKDLTISGQPRVGTSSYTRKLSKSQSNLQHNRPRLVDRLKETAPSSDDANSEDEVVEISELTSVKQVERIAESVPPRPNPVKRPSQTSQSQGQKDSSMTNRPKITYSSMRSFLPEDSLEADLMVGLDSEPAKHATHQRSFGKSTSNSQRSAFDFDDADNEDGSQGGIRTIHELRAAGRTISGMYDIQELLSDIQNHNVSHRSRRRSALIELANKLADKAFATRFTGQSLETELALECTTTSDQVADFALAAAFCFILASEPPEHTVRTLHDQGVISWLARHLEENTDITKIAKDRRNNMARSAQGSLVDFANLMAKQTSLWGDEKPTVVTSRLVALKALDLLISKLRRLGERSDLMAAEHIPLVLSPEDNLAEEGRQIDVALSLSVLESLSTTEATLHWPVDTVTTIAATLPRLHSESPLLRHTLFLTLRLCLNLTTDNTPNSQILGREPTFVRYFLNAMKLGFDELDSDVSDETRALALDLLVLAMGIMMNLADKCDEARVHALEDEDTLSSLLEIFQRGQKHMLDAESVEESVTNVAFGYLAVVLSNMCQNEQARTFIASKLPGKNLGMLVEAVEEFVLHHQKVDMMNFEGAEGAEVWGAFTEKLRMVLARLKEAEHSML